MEGGLGVVTTLRWGARTCEDEPDKPVRLRGGRALLRLFRRISSVHPIGFPALASRRHRAARYEAGFSIATERNDFERDPAVR